MILGKEARVLSEKSVDILDFISKKEIGIPELIRMMFDNYIEKKKNKSLYSGDDFIPQNLIKIYYGSCCHQGFDIIANNFKKKYLTNENNLEDVRKRQERQGLEVVYDYINGDSWKNIDNIYIVCLIHQLLYSKIPHTEFGGKFRNVTSYVTNGDYNIAVDYSLIPSEMSKLYPLYKELVEMADRINCDKDTSHLIEYIDKCIELKCKIIRIHPFADGNGRTSRAMLNIFFKRVNLPPTYVRFGEKKEYIEAMDKAIRLSDSSAIRKFYYYKICDSIIELDINDQIEKEKIINKSK
ncbi:MAG: Fic family protein [Bacilli bacterium]|nr:Fic family protein [Bacilli bacterium]